jgi:hypothetical protein
MSILHSSIDAHNHEFWTASQVIMPSCHHVAPLSIHNHETYLTALQGLIEAPLLAPATTARAPGRRGQQRYNNGSRVVPCSCVKATGNKSTKRTATEPSVTCAEHAATASSEPPDWLMLRASACHRVRCTSRSERQVARVTVKCCGVRTSSHAKDARALQPAACTPAWRGCICSAVMMAFTAPAIQCANVCGQ